MEYYDEHHWHWWHWLILIAVIFIVLGIGYTWISNMKNDKDQSYVNGIEQTIEHPIDKTQNAVNDVVK